MCVCLCICVCVSAGECKTKTDEDAIMAKEVSALKAILNTAKPDKARMREYLVRLMYIDVRTHTPSHMPHIRSPRAPSSTKCA